MIGFPSHMPCPECGASVLKIERASHVCDVERRLDYEMFRLRGEIGDFEPELGVWLESPQGRFASYLAQTGHS